MKPQPFVFVRGKPRLDTKRTYTEIKFTYNRRTAFSHSNSYSSERFTSLKNTLSHQRHQTQILHDSKILVDTIWGDWDRILWWLSVEGGGSWEGPLGVAGSNSSGESSMEKPCGSLGVTKVFWAFCLDFSQNIRARLNVTFYRAPAFMNLVVANNRQVTLRFLFQKVAVYSLV